MEGCRLKQKGLLASLKETLKLICCDPALTVNDDVLLMKQNREVFMTDITFIRDPLRLLDNLKYFGANAVLCCY